MTTVIEILSEYKDRGVKISLAQDGHNLSIKGNVAGLSAEDKVMLKSRKTELIEFLQWQKGSTQSIPVIADAAHFAISDAQRRLWILDQLDGDVASYNIPAQVILDGEYDVELIKKAIASTIERHEVLRTNFSKLEDGEVRQFIVPVNDFKFDIDYRDFTEQESPETAIAAYIEQDQFKRFELENGPLIRAAFLKKDVEQYVFYYNMHHIISDGWSMGVLMKDVLAFYTAYSAESEPSLPTLNIQYRDYAAWQVAHVNSQEFHKQRDYWKQTLAGTLPTLDLPSNKRRPKLNSANGRIAKTYVDEKLTSALNAYCKEQGGTLFMGLLAVTNALFHRYTSLTDIIIGTPVAGRNHPDLQPQIGLYVNTLALRSEFDSKTEFSKLFEQAKATTLQAFANQDYSFDRLIDDLAVVRDTSRNAVFDVMLSLQNAAENTAASADLVNLIDAIEDGGEASAKLDVELTFVEVEERLLFEVTYNTDVYDQSMIEGLMIHFKQLLRSVLAFPETSIGQVDFLNDAEHKTLLEEFNSSTAPLSTETTVVEAFTKQIALTPDATALTFAGVHSTYAELDQRSNQLANYLSSKGVKKGGMVPFELPRSDWQLVSILAVLKTGAAYVPIDTEYPQDRIDYIKEDCSGTLTIDDHLLEAFKAVQSDCSTAALEVELDAESPAYIIYTSGSTGQPKGVVISHNNLVQKLHEEQALLALDNPVTYCLTNYVFDVSLLELVYPLLFGGRVVIPSADSIGDPNNTIAEILKEQVTILQGTPTYFNQFLSSVPSADLALLNKSLQVLCIGGEALTQDLVQKVNTVLSDVCLNNHYGPTEITIDAIVSTNVKELPFNCIGKPIGNTKVYIVTSAVALSPTGVAGEICIGGPSVAQGYLNRTDLTAEYFVPNPFASKELMYRTGDLGRWHDDGTIEFLGRIDEQVKVRGYRIELGEVEHALSTIEQITGVTVTTHKNAADENELAAYFIALETLDANAIRAELKLVVPAYMIPTYFLQIEEMPLTRNGKVDKKALPLPTASSTASDSEYVPASTDIEKQLVQIWEEVLERSPIGIENDFFELGGHSLKATRLINAYSTAFGAKLGLKELFLNTTIKSHSILVEGAGNSAQSVIPVVKEAAHYPISDAQRRLWVLSQFDGASIAYNMPTQVALGGEYDIDALIRAIHKTVERHESLRTVFIASDESEVSQQILSSSELGFQVQTQDLTGHQAPNQEAQELIAKDCELPFDLEKGPLLRAVIFNLKQDDSLLYLNMHHIISDGWSMNILARDVLSFYEGEKEGGKPYLPAPLRIQYKDYAAWQIAQLSTAETAISKNYWTSKLQGALPALELYGAKERPSKKTSSGHTYAVSIPTTVTAQLNEYVRAHGGSVFMGLLASVTAILHRYSGQKDIVVGSPIAGREMADLANQIGFYVNTLALRNEINGEESFDSLFSRVKDETLEAYQNQSYPFDRLVNDLELSRDTSRSAVFDVMLVLQNEEQGPISIEDTEVQDGVILDLGKGTSKFDVLLTFQQHKGKLFLTLEVNDDLFDKTWAEAFLSHYLNFAKNVFTKPSQAVGVVELLSETERKALLEKANETAVAYDDLTVMELFGRQTLKAPDELAVVFQEEQSTYSQLQSKTNQLAHLLTAEHKVAPGHYVGVMLNRSLASVEVMIGIMKTGAAYVPIDPNYPSARIDFIIKDAGIKVLITEESALSTTDYPTENTVIYANLDLDSYSAQAPEVVNQPSDTAFVIYTSGSTGTPKGVEQTHRMLTNLVQWGISDPNIETGVKRLQYASFSFDVSLQDCWTALAAGDSLYVCNTAIRTDFGQLLNYVVDENIEVLSLPFSVFERFFIDNDATQFEGHAIKHVISSGEQLLVNTEAQRFFEADPEIQLHNHYGPSETHVVTSHTMSVAQGNLQSRSPIGAPVANTAVYLLNEQGTLVQNGGQGELYFGGAHLANGYLGQPELTAEKFISSPFEAGKLLYKTGDLAEWTDAGTLEYLGRIDDQIKLRGYRIELGEIEHALLAVKGITSAVAMVRELSTGERELVAYFSAVIEHSRTSIYQAIQSVLPEYMIPAMYVQLNELPLTSNGKVDKNALPHPEENQVQSGIEYVAPKTEQERLIIQIWENVLGKEELGMNSEFFALGGHSLKATRLLSEYKKQLNVELMLKDIFVHTSVQLHAKLIGEATIQEFVGIQKIQDAASYHISDAQRRIWVLSQFEEASVTYNLPMQTVLEGKYDVEQLNAAIQATVERHEILRTVFQEQNDGTVKQSVLPVTSVNSKTQFLDFSSLEDGTAKAAEFISKDALVPFDLENGPCFRIAILQVEDEKYILYFNLHHIVSDGWSIEIIRRDVMAFYDALQHGQDVSLPTLSVQYRDYAAWQLAQVELPEFAERKSYWHDALSGEIPVTSLPTQLRRPKVKSYNGSTLGTIVSGKTTSEFRTFCNDQGGSLFMGLVTVWNALCYRYTLQQDHVIGTPIAGREHADLENQIGCYINTLAIKTTVDPSGSFTALFGQVKDVLLNAYLHQSYPFDRLVEELPLTRDLSRNALFDVLITLQNTGENSSAQKSRSETAQEFTDFGTGIAKFDLDLTFEEVGDELFMSINYNTDVYTKELATGLLHHFIQMMNSAVAAPKESISKLSFLQEAEKAQLLSEFNKPVVASEASTITDLFEDAVKQHGNKAAIVFGDTTLSYAEFDKLSSQFANYLLEKKEVQTGDLIGVILERSELMIIALLGIQKAGCAYVPVDPSFPESRIDYIKSDSNAAIYIDDSVLAEFTRLQNEFEEVAENRASADGLVYVIYTSGSTGNPKGVQVEHKQVTQFIKALDTQLGFADVNSFAFTTNLTFDISVLEIFGAICLGKTLHVFDAETLSNPTEIVDQLSSKNIEGVQFTPSRLSQIVEMNVELPSTLKLLLVGGEALPEEAYGWLKNQAFKSFNVYGPTETTIWSTALEVKSSSQLSIGRPLAGEQIHILNDALELQGLMMPGEICIAGAGVTRGYLNRNELTTEKFVNNPFANGESMYKTGDVGRWLPDGTIEFIGRNDDQVKIRGHRIELGEIEHAIILSTKVRQVVVDAVPNEAGISELTAYLVTEHEIDITAMRLELRNQLPVYMLPTHFVEVDIIPLNASGKIDRRALRTITGATLSNSTAYIAPSTAMEIELAAIWEKLFKREKIGAQDDFFELGGHSLMLTRLTSEYHRSFNIKLTLRQLFESTTIAAHANLLADSEAIEYVQIPKIEEAENYPISDTQRRLYILSQFDGASATYNMPSSILLEGTYERELLEYAIRSTVERHEILRTVFREDQNGELRQWILPKEQHDFELDYLDLRADAKAEKSLAEFVEHDSVQEFDLKEGLLLRATLVQMTENQFVFCYNMHHIISDGWSLNVLAQDVLAFYRQHNNAGETALPALRIQYKDYTAWQIERSNSPAFEKQKQFWLNQLSGELPLLDLPSEKMRPKIKSSNGHRLGTFISAETTKALKSYCQETGGTLFMGLLASINVMLYRYAGQDELLIGSPVAGRNNAELENQIGFYVNTLVFRNQIKASDTWDQHFGNVKSNVLAAFANQEYPFDRLVDELDLVRHTSRSAVFDVMLAFHNNNNEDVNYSNDVANVVCDYGGATSKFDLLFDVAEANDKISFIVEYNTDVYEQQNIERFIKYYLLCLEGLLENKDAEVGSIDFLDVDERQQLLHGFNDTYRDYLPETVMQLFERQVAKTPHDLALMFESQSMSYAEVNEQSNRIANYLRTEFNITAQHRVGVMLKRSFESAITMIGVMKSGACYVPIDYNYPTERISYMLKDSDVSVILTQTDLLEAHPIEDQTLINIDELALAAFSDQNPVAINKLADASFVIYTSGSTGLPKGVEQTHLMMSNLIQWDIHDSGLASGMRHLQYSSFSFDASLHDIYFALSAGGSCYIASEEIRMDYALLRNEILDKKLEILSFPFSALSNFFSQNELESLSGHAIKYIVSTAEQLYVGDDLKRFLESHPNVELHNHYGPSESHVVTSHMMSAGAKNIVHRSSIGKPVSNSTIYILNENMTLVPQGVRGEVYIGGDNLALGYLNLPEATASRFIAHPFIENELVYKTGDIAYWKPDGTIEYIGRNDDQVKVRGFRIELGEIENVLVSNEEIEDAVVLIKGKENEQKDLVAYILAKKEQNLVELRQFLKTRLPDYMVPSFFVQLDEIPLNHNGKVDKNALPEPAGLGLSSGVEYVAPRNDIEEKLAKIWQEVLQRENIGINDDFFLLGGQSIKALKIKSKVGTEFSVEIALERLFLEPTIANLADHIEHINWNHSESDVELEEYEF